MVGSLGKSFSVPELIVRLRTNEQNTLSSFAILSSDVKIILWSFTHSTARGRSIGIHQEGRQYRTVAAGVELYLAKGIIKTFVTVSKRLAQCWEERLVLLFKTASSTPGDLFSE